MRDYKNVTVPRKYRTTSRTRTVNRRTDIGPVRKKKTAGRLREVFTVAVGIAVTAVLCYGGWAGYRWMTTAAIFQIAGIDVRGTHHVSDDDIRQMAASFDGQNVFLVDIDAAARRAAANPWVRDVRIERKLPNRISMVFEERAPRAVLHAANGAFLMDSEGIAIIPVRQGDPLAAALPAISVQGVRASLRQPVAADALPAALRLLDELAIRGGWDLAAVTIRAESPETIAVVYAGHEFRLGSGSYPEKLRRLGEIVSDMNRRGLDYAYVDLRPTRQAAVMVRNRGGRGTGRE
jgi:cell division septal protein FtsQ